MQIKCSFVPWYMPEEIAVIYDSSDTHVGGKFVFVYVFEHFLNALRYISNILLFSGSH